MTTSYYLGGTLVAQRENTTLRYTHQDHLSGTSLMTDTNGNSLGTMKYYPYGSTRSGSVPTDELFTGQKLDGTGLYYYGARYYDPTIGRFISPDTIIPNPADPQSYNRYSYCLNNPLKYVDPSGHVVNILGYDARYLDSLTNSPEALSLALSNDPGLVDVLTSAEYNAHKAAQASDPDWVSGLEESETTYDVENLSETSTSTTSTVLYVSESVTYSKQVQSVHVAAPEVNGNTGGVNLNFTFGEGVVGTMGYIVNGEGIYDYSGVGVGFGAPFSGSISYTDTPIKTGWCIEAQGYGILGVFGGGAGRSLGEVVDWDYFYWQNYGEYGAGFPPSASVTVYYVRFTPWSEVGNRIFGVD